ncbi:MAG: efflux RND transporter periplasmic adaptor subunit [Bacteroidales bacterium]|nr:efflux RND transporter periplasmic adaptor subunit [Bacteroidales bacterium]
MKKVLKIMGIALIIILFIGTLIFLFNKSKIKPIVYETELPAIRDLEKKIVINGAVSPRDEVQIKPQISGIITEIYKQPGDKVAVGDIIAKVKVIPDIGQVSVAESRVRVAQIALNQLESEYQRTEKLYLSGVNSKEEYENSKAAYLKAKEELSNAQENLEIVKDGISKSSTQTSNTLIKATISGMVLDVPVKVGNSVIQSNTFNDGTTIAVIANMKDLIFIGKVDETEVGKVAEGNQVTLTIGALQDAHFEAELEYIAPKGTVENGATFFEIRAAIHNYSGGLIRSGYSANGEVIIDKKNAVLSIPESSIEFQHDTAFVFIENPSNSKELYTKKAVTLGISDGIYIEVLDGVFATDKIRGKIKI